MDILLIGSGGREHALAWKLKQSGRVGKIYVGHGNGGTAKDCINIPVKDNDLTGLLTFAYENRIGLTVVGPEALLTEGIVDVFEAHGLKIFGPSKKAAEIEGSKAFMKDVLARAGVPTADFKIFESPMKAQTYLEHYEGGVVVKADGLAAGKGVFVCETRREAQEAVEALMVEHSLGNAGDVIVLEELLRGQEVSVLSLTDGQTLRVMPACQDHKQAYDGDKGPNTGGMGAISPLPFYDKAMQDHVLETILKPTLKTMDDLGRTFKGVLFGGFMLTEKGPKVLEYNARFGDPETQTLMQLLDSDLLDALEATAMGKLHEVPFEFKNKAAANVVLASGGYPGSYEKGKLIEGLDDVDEDVTVFHAGTKFENGKFYTNGGRVMNVSAMGDDLDAALAKIYKNIEKIKFDGMAYRKDIGFRLKK